MTESNKKYSISDLEDMSGVSRRTIHFYVKEGLIPSSYGTGGGAYYGEEHLLRLLLIKDLQNSHLKLSGIKQALDRLTPDDMRRLVGKSPRHFPSTSRESLETWLEGDLQMALNRGMSDSSRMAPRTRNYSFAQMSRSVMQRTTAPVWERHPIADGVEIHLRADVAARYRQALSEVVSIFRKKL